MLTGLFLGKVGGTAETSLGLQPYPPLVKLEKHIMALESAGFSEILK